LCIDCWEFNSNRLSLFHRGIFRSFFYPPNEEAPPPKAELFFNRPQSFFHLSPVRHTLIDFLTGPSNAPDCVWFFPLSTRDAIPLFFALSSVMGRSLLPLLPPHESPLRGSLFPQGLLPIFYSPFHTRTRPFLISMSKDFFSDIRYLC